LGNLHCTACDVHRPSKHLSIFILGSLRQPPRNGSRVMGFAGSGNYLFRYIIYCNGLPWRYFPRRRPVSNIDLTTYCIVHRHKCNMRAEAMSRQSTVYDMVVKRVLVIGSVIVYSICKGECMPCHEWQCKWRAQSD
jgi:hypothetical protein